MALTDLVLEITQVDVPDTIDFGDTGSAVLTIANPADEAFTGDISLNLFISTDDDMDSASDEVNDALLANLTSNQTIGAGETIEIVIDYENNTGVIAPGNYHLLAEIADGDVETGFDSQVVSAEGSNAVQVWHAFALNAIQEFGETDNDPTGIGIEPTVGSRGLAIVQTSVFNAVNAFDGGFESYLGLDPGTPVEGASDAAAAVGASVASLASVLPGTTDLQSQIVAQLQVGFGISEAEAEDLLVAAGVGDILDAPEGAEIGSFFDPFLGIDGGDIEAPTAAPAGIPDAIFDGFVFGINAAAQVIEARSGDGFTGFFDGLDDPSTYVPPGTFEEYVWIGEVPLNADDGTPVFGDGVPFALSPGWGSLDSFTDSDILDFYNAAGIDESGDGLFLDGRPFDNPIDTDVDDFEFERYVEGLEGDGGPNVLGGAASVFLGGPDQEDFGVREYGALFDTDVTTVLRDDNETEIAIFWAYDRADTFRPYGQLHQIAQEATYRDGDNSLVGDARTLALTSISLAEAAVAAWFAKYDEVQSRPDDVISGDGQGDPIAGLDDSDETLVDPDYETLLPSPPFPDFLSGHSTFAGAFGGALDVLFPEATGIEVVSQELVGNGVNTTSDDEAFNAAFPEGTFGQVRTFDSYLEIGFEDAISRVYGGVHVQEATDDAVLAGIEIGAFVAENFLLAVDDTDDAGTVVGTAGDDSLDGGIDFASDDTVITGSGDDEIDSNLAPELPDALSDGIILSGSGEDAIFTSDDDLVFGGTGDDTLAVLGEGARVSGGAGIDSFIFEEEASNNRVLGGEGDDIFTINSGSDNLLSGGEGADSFAFVIDQPVADNVIVDFDAAIDSLEIVDVGGIGGELEFDGSDVIFGGVTVVTLIGVDAATAGVELA